MTNETWHDVGRICGIKTLPPGRIAEADRIAIAENPQNEPPARDGAPSTAGHRLVVERRVYWGSKGVRLTVGFLDNPSSELRRRILSHMNAWNKTANVEFVESKSDPQVRIARLDSPPSMNGYWSYLGTDILSIPADEPTMNLEAFTMSTPESEFVCVVRHETGHTLGFPHEHMRGALIERLDTEKVVEEFMRTQGWSRRDVINQILTPLESSSILGSFVADQDSIMSYQIGGHLTHDGQPIRGGVDINYVDYRIAGALYPKPKG